MIGEVYVTDNEPSTKKWRTLNLALTDEELNRIRRLRDRLQEREREYIKVSIKRTFLEALDALEAKLDKLDRDRERSR